MVLLKTYGPKFMGSRTNQKRNIERTKAHPGDRCTIRKPPFNTIRMLITYDNAQLC